MRNVINIVPEKSFIDLYLKEVISDISKDGRLIENLYPKKRVNHRSGKFDWFKYIYQYTKFFLQAYTALGKSKPSIVVLHTPSIQLLGVLLKVFYSRHTFICFCHGTFSNPNLNSFKQKIIVKIEQYVLANFKKVVCVSKSLADSMLLTERKPNEVFVCPPGILLQARKLCYKVQLPTEVQKIGFVGRINKDKGLEDLIRLKKELEINLPKIEFLVFGAIEDPALAHELKFNGVKLKGFVNDKSKIYQSFDLFLFPTKREGLPLVAMEAVKFCRPVFGYDILGLRDAIENGTTGELVEPFNFERLFEAVLKIIKDKNLFRRYVKNCDLTSRNYADLSDARAALREFIVQ